MQVSGISTITMVGGGGLLSQAGGEELPSEILWLLPQDSWGAHHFFSVLHVFLPLTRAKVEWSEVGVEGCHSTLQVGLILSL